MRFAFLLFLALTLPAKAQQQGSTITLSCDGTSKTMGSTAAPTPVTDVGIVVNGTDRTVTFMADVVPITGLTATLVSFGGRQSSVVYGLKSNFAIDGQVDRVTGYTQVHYVFDNGGGNTAFELKCRPATRMF